MSKKLKRVFGCCLIISMVLTQMFFSSSAAAESSESKRLAGSDRYKTAAAISQKGWPNGSLHAVIARGDDFADALCAGPLAKKLSAPILLTQSGELNADTFNELKRLKVKNVVIVGGAGAISSKVEDALTIAGISKIERLWGNDRYETSVKIAEKLGTSTEAVLATGANFPDALSISAVAAKLGMPILLTDANSLPEKVNTYIKEKKITKTYVIGGTGVISDTVKNLVPGAVRLGGKDRYETNTVVMQEFASKLDFKKLYLAIGEGPGGNEFADALAGAVLASYSSSPVVLVYNGVPQVTASFLKPKVTFATSIVTLGGEAVVPSAVAESLIAYKKGIPVKASYDKAGTYGPTTGTETISGNVVISAADVTLQNVVIEGDLVLAESIGDGNVSLKNIFVKGTTVINGGGPNSVIMYNFNGQTVVVDVPDGGNVRLVASGTTSIESVEMQSDGRLEESGLTGSGFADIVIPEGATVSLSGNFGTVDIQAGGATVNVEGGAIGTMNISAANSTINLAASVSVASMNVSAPVSVTGTGTIASASITSNGVTMQQTPTTVTRTENVTEGQVGSTPIDSVPVSGGQTPPAGGGGGGGGAITPDITVSGIKVNTSGGDFGAYNVVPSFNAIANTVLLQSMEFNVTPADSTVVIESLRARGYNWLKDPVTKAIPANGKILTGDIIGVLDGGAPGVSLGNLRRLLGNGDIEFAGHIERAGYNNKNVSVVVTLGGAALPTVIESQWATLEKSVANIELKVKLPNTTLETAGLFPGLASNAIWPYAVKRTGDPDSQWKIGEAAIKTAIATSKGTSWNLLKLNDIIGDSYDVQMFQNSTVYTLTVSLHP